MSTQPGKSETQTDSVPPRVENASKILVKENSAAILKGQLEYCYSQTMIEPTYTSNFLYSKKLCIYLCTKSMRLVLPI